MMRGPDSAINHSAPDSASIALLIIDMFSDYEDDGSAPLFKGALRAAKHIARLKHRAAVAGVPTIYVNDNYGRWRSAGGNVIERAERSERGAMIVELLRPSVDDYVMLKPKHSAFFATPLEVLLSYIGTRALILTGLSGTQCVLFTAMDAYVRDFQLYVPRDCVVSQSLKEEKISEYMMRQRLKADIRDSVQLRLANLKRRHGSPKK